MNKIGMGITVKFLKDQEPEKYRINIQGSVKKPEKKQEMNPEIERMKRWAESEQRGQKISSLNTKMLSGARLTKEEMEYLRINSPEHYEKAVKIEKEREQYKKELEKCRSKQDVDELKQRKMDMYFTEAKGILANPNIPKLKKAIMVEFVIMRMAAIMREDADFKQTERYNRLPQGSDIPEDSTSSAEEKFEAVNAMLAETEEAHVYDAEGKREGKRERGEIFIEV